MSLIFYFGPQEQGEDENSYSIQEVMCPACGAVTEPGEYGECLCCGEYMGENDEI